MIVCPNCQTENRAGAKFCRNCAAPLPPSPASTRPLDNISEAPQSNLSAVVTMRLDQATGSSGPSTRTITKSLPAGQVFVQRPPGAIFGDIFIYKELVYSDEHGHRYTVSQPNLPKDLQILACTDPACGAVFPPRGAVPEKFCTDCGNPLESISQDLLLTETDTPFPESVSQIIAKGLSHGSIRTPLAIFEERLAGSPRNCLVTTPVVAFGNVPEVVKALKWGKDLARGLDYLHDNGVSFSGQLEDSHFGLVGDKLVWSNFTNSINNSDGFIADRQPDVRSLASLVFHWLTGRSQFVPDSNLSQEVNRVFQQASTASGFATGRDLAEAFDQALKEEQAHQAVDFRIGRRTHVGMVRTLNEDSVLTIELNRTRQSISQPLGVFVVADGMGGHAAGEIASGTIIDVITKKAFAELMPPKGDKTDPGKWLHEAVEEANKEVFSLRKSAGTDMGSTLVSAVLDGSQAYITHVGDSRAYLINSGGIRQLTTDHSLVQRMIAAHQISREEARYHPQRNVIYRTIGDKLKIEVEVSSITMASGDFLLLCSDGLSGMVVDDVIWDLVLGAVSPQAACDSLIDAANQAGGEDNVSVLIIKVVRV